MLYGDDAAEEGVPKVGADGAEVHGGEHGGVVADLGVV